MHRAASLLVLWSAATGCVGPDPEAVRASDLRGARAALESNLAAIHARDAEAYLEHYLESPDFTVASADSVARGFWLFAEARRASSDWPDTLVAGVPTLVWVAPGVVWGTFPFVGVQAGDTARGWSDRLFVKTADGWRIAVTGVMQRCAG